MIGDEKEVYFAKWCPKCENNELSEFEDPCNECLYSPANQDSHKPINFKEATNEKPNRSSKEQPTRK